jgi:hypothetical protein
MSHRQARTAFHARQANPHIPKDPLNRLARHIPGSENFKVFVLTTGIVGFLALTFFPFQAKKSGHNWFDQNKPAAIEEAQSKARAEQGKV